MSWSTSELRMRLAHTEPSLSPLVKYLTDLSKAVLFLWIIYVISVLFCYAFMHICLLMPCGHLLGKGWPLGSRLWCLLVKLSLSYWYLGSGVLLDCIDSWSLPSFLLKMKWNKTTKFTCDTRCEIACNSTREDSPWCNSANVGGSPRS